MFHIPLPIDMEVLLIPQASSIFPIQTPWPWFPQLSRSSSFPSPPRQCAPVSEYMAVNGEEEVSTMTMGIMIRDTPPDILPLFSSLCGSGLPLTHSAPNSSHLYPNLLKLQSLPQPSGLSPTSTDPGSPLQGPGTSWRCVSAPQAGKGGPGIHKYKSSLFTIRRLL